MGGYGYVYRSFATYNTSSTVRDEPKRPVRRPFAPFVPNTNTNTVGFVPKKTIVPVASRPYGDDYYEKPSKGYPMTVRDDDDDDDDDDKWPRQTSPVRGGRTSKVDEFLTKVQNEASRPPPRFTPVTSTDWRQSPQPPTASYNGYGGGDYGNKEGRKPIGSTIRNDNYDGYNTNYGTTNGHGGYGGNYSNKDGYNGTDGYGGDYGNYGNKERPKPYDSSDYDGYGNKERPKPVSSPNYNGKGYGGYGNKEGPKPISSPRYDDSGHGKYGNKEGPKPITGPNYDASGYGKYGNKEGPKPHDGIGYGSYGNKEGPKPIGSPNYDGNGYGSYSNKEGPKPISSPRYNGNSYGNYGNKEGPKPVGSPSYDRHQPPAENYSALTEPNKTMPGGLTRPKLSSDNNWTPSPRNGTHLSEPTNDIEKAMELLREATKLTPSGHSSDHGNKDEPVSKVDKGLELVEEAARNKNIATGRPQSRSSSVVTEPATPNNKDDYGYGEAVDPSRDTTRVYGNFNLASTRPRASPTPRTNISYATGEPDDDHYRNNFDIIDSRDTTRRPYGTASRSLPAASTIDSRELEKLYNGRRI